MDSMWNFLKEYIILHTDSALYGFELNTWFVTVTVTLKRTICEKDSTEGLGN